MDLSYYLKALTTSSNRIVATAISNYALNSFIYGGGLGGYTANVPVLGAIDLKMFLALTTGLSLVPGETAGMIMYPYFSSYAAAAGLLNFAQPALESLGAGATAAAVTYFVAPGVVALEGGLQQQVLVGAASALIGNQVANMFRGFY